jgi:hypothetical protein
VRGRLVRVVLPILALLLLAAHFYRAGAYPLVAVAIALAGLAFVARPWAGRALGLVLLLGAVEWLRTALVFAALRDSMGQPFGRLLAILGAVALFTLTAAYVAWPGAETGAGGKSD